MSEEEEEIANIGIPEEKEPSSFKLIMALGIAGLLSGIILVSTYLYTLPLIEANKAAAMERAIFKVLPDCTSFKTFKLESDALVEKVEEGDKKKKKDDGEEQLIYAGYNESDEFIGFAIPGSKAGFQDIIVAIFGYDAVNKKIIGFEVLESKETPGLGDKIFKDEAFQTNFKELIVDPEIMLVKNGQKENSNEVEAITGATISSKAVVGLLNETMTIWRAPADNFVNKNINN